MRIVITGSDGFIGRNLKFRLQSAVGGRQLAEGQRLVTSGQEQLPQEQLSVVGITRSTTEDDCRRLLSDADFVFHLAGVNRPADEAEFESGNVGFTRKLCGMLAELGRAPTVVLASSTQAGQDNSYGRSKRAAEQVVEDYAVQTGAAVYVARLPNVFGKWSRPDYNSAVATFCYRAARGLEIEINDPHAELTLLYIDDLVDFWVSLLDGAPRDRYSVPANTYRTTVGEVARQITSFAELRRSRDVGHVGAGLARALYATYVSFLPTDQISYPLELHTDERGSFAEVLRTPDSGQVSFFTAHPGVTRGGHYHHTKTEKFVVVNGSALFRFRNIADGELLELRVSGDSPHVVETLPGWAHDITNIGEDLLIVLLWANERFDPDNPDTVPYDM